MTISPVFGKSTTELDHSQVAGRHWPKLAEPASCTRETLSQTSCWHSKSHEPSPKTRGWSCNRSLVIGHGLLENPIGVSVATFHYQRVHVYSVDLQVPSNIGTFTNQSSGQIIIIHSPELRPPIFPLAGPLPARPELRPFGHDFPY